MSTVPCGRTNHGTGDGCGRKTMSECGEAPCGSMLDSSSQESSLIWSDMERCVAGIFEMSNFGRVRAAVSLVG
jgi:hypothetical protein